MQICLLSRSFIDSIALKPPEDLKDLKGVLKKKSEKQKEDNQLQKKVKYCRFNIQFTNIILIASIWVYRIGGDQSLEFFSYWLSWWHNQQIADDRIGQKNISEVSEKWSI